jgi:hypothetical protein
MPMPMQRPFDTPIRPIVAPSRARVAVSRRCLVPPTFLLLVLAVISSGCGDNDGRLSVSGNVKLDGKPLPEGSIEFLPIAGTGGPTAGATIEEGKYRIAAGRGLFAGQFRVKITAQRNTGRQATDPYRGVKYDVQEQYLPARYNRKSQLEATLTPEGANVFDFDLKGP